MDLHFIWKAVLIVFVGIVILRIGGRKSISQLTVSQTVIMISIGTIMIQPVSNRNIWITFVIALLLVLTLVFVEILQLKYDKVENFFSGKSVVIIENGIAQHHNLKKIRLSYDQLEIRLRQANIQQIADVKWATIEPSGQLGFVLQEEKQPATKQDIQVLIDYIHSTFPNGTKPPQIVSTKNDPLFREVKDKKHLITPRADQD